MELTQEQRELAERVESIFFAYAEQRQKRMLERNLRLVHYTTAEGAISIIKSRTFWMRDTRSMSDFREVQHGYDLLLKYFNQGDNRPKFFAAMDKCFPDAGSDTLKRFDAWWAHIQSATYICCLSEHVGKSDDQYGRLSMWRAYGQKSGIAIVLKPPGKFSAIPLNVFLSPVAYFAEEDFWREIDSVVERIQAHHQFLRSLPREQLVFFAYRMLVIATVSVKHPAFREEREWRLVYFPFEQPSPYVSHTTETLGGVPQLVYKVPLKNEPDANITGITLPELLDRVIIGPSQFPGPIYASLVEELTNAGVPDAAKKVFFSGIPLRT